MRDIISEYSRHSTIDDSLIIHGVKNCYKFDFSVVEQTSFGSQWSCLRIVFQSGPDDAPFLFRGRNDPALEFTDVDLSRRL